MNNLELTIEALKLCVPPAKFAAAMEKVQATELVYIPSESDVEKLAQDVLTAIGVPSHLRGYRFLTTGLAMMVYEPSLIYGITTKLYPMIAGRCGGTTKQRVERGIRHAIEIAWDNSDPDDLAKYFGKSVSYYKGRPTNGAFLARLSDLLRRKLEKKGVV